MSLSLIGSLVVSGARVKWLRLVVERFFLLPLECWLYAASILTISHSVDFGDRMFDLYNQLTRNQLTRCGTLLAWKCMEYVERNRRSGAAEVDGLIYGNVRLQNPGTCALRRWRWQIWADSCWDLGVGTRGSWLGTDTSRRQGMYDVSGGGACDAQLHLSPYDPLVLC